MTYITPEQLQQLKEIERIKKMIMRKLLTKEALERLGRVKLVKPSLAEQLELYLVQLYQQGQLKTVIDDSKLKQILTSLAKGQKFKLIR